MSEMRTQNEPTAEAFPIRLEPVVALSFTSFTSQLLPFQVPRMKLTTAVLSGESESIVAWVWAGPFSVKKVCIAAPLTFSVPVKVSETCTGVSMGVVGVLSLAHPAAPMQAKTRANVEMNRNIGNPILLDKIAGLSKGLIGMKVFAVALALSLVLSAAPSFAQAQAPAQPLAAAAGQGQPPSTAKPAPTPSTAKPAPAPATQPPPPPKVPFQMGLKYGYVQLQEVAQTSAQGKAFNARVQQLQDQKVKELQDKNKQLQAAQDKLDKGASVLADSARASLQAEIERLQRDIQRYTEDAQQEIQTLTQQLQADFERLLMPIIDKVAKEKQVHFVFDAAQSGLVWADPSMNLTGDVIAALDAAGTAKPTAAAAPATPK